MQAIASLTSRNFDASTRIQEKCKLSVACNAFIIISRLELFDLNNFEIKYKFIYIFFIFIV